MWEGYSGAVVSRPVWQTGKNSKWKCTRIDRPVAWDDLPLSMDFGGRLSGRGAGFFCIFKFAEAAMCTGRIAILAGLALLLFAHPAPAADMFVYFGTQDTTPGTGFSPGPL